MQKDELIPINRACHAVGIIGGTKLVPTHSVKQWQVIWKLGTHKFPLGVPNLQMCCFGLVGMIWLKYG